MEVSAPGASRGRSSGRSAALQAPVAKKAPSAKAAQAKPRAERTAPSSSTPLARPARARAAAEKSPGSSKTTIEKLVAAPETKATAAQRPKRVRRARVPENLAQMYGQSEAKRALDVPVEEPKKARRDAATRALRRQVMQADERVVERLARAQERSVAALVVGEDEEVKRKRTWQVRCGRCGASSSFKTPAALCPRCSAICVKP
jgi:rubrerythrin